MNIYSILVGNPEGKRPPARPWHRWEDNIKMDLQEVGREEIEWIHLAQNEGSPFECGNEPPNSINCREFLDKLRTC
jgi:hypothetical protein